MEKSIKNNIEARLLEIKDKPDEYFLSPEFWVFIYETCQTYDNWELFHELKKRSKKLAGDISVEIIQGFEISWKLPSNPDPIMSPSRSLATTNSTQFEQIKRSLKRIGEGTHCWSCGISSDDSKSLPANTRHYGLSAHEWWDWNEVTFIRKLVAVRFLCFDCHYLTGRDAIWTLETGKAEIHLSRIKRFCRVNSCTVPQMWAQMQHAREKWQRLNKTNASQWTLDLSITNTLMNK